MKFKKGDSVEVSSKEEGFLGSYYEAFIVEPIQGKNKYLVQYKTLLTDDEKSYLREVADGNEIRPVPPVIRVYDFNILDEIDVFANDGWWVGRITGRDRFLNYNVYFDSTVETIPYKFSELRIHQEWENGRWVLSQKPHIYRFG